MLFLLVCLTVWRASSLVVSERGPFGFFDRWRAWVWKRLGEDSGHWIVEGLGCIWCVSFWAGLVTAIFLGEVSLIAWVEVPFWWLGSSAGAILLNEFVGALSYRGRR